MNITLSNKEQGHRLQRNSPSCCTNNYQGIFSRNYGQSQIPVNNCKVLTLCKKMFQGFDVDLEAEWALCCQTGKHFFYWSNQKSTKLSEQGEVCASAPGGQCDCNLSEWQMAFRFFCHHLKNWSKMESILLIWPQVIDCYRYLPPLKLSESLCLSCCCSQCLFHSWAFAVLFIKQQSRLSKPINKCLF